jgi:ElaB/YqjD/DUF883 family membrane-anchored ribosome-binding protein
MKKKPVNVAKEQLIEDFKVVIADAEALLKATANQGDAKLDEVRAKAEESLREVKAGLGEAQTALFDQTTEVARAADAYVHENPWTALSIAAGIGLVIGLLNARN